jgi:HCO3- transporter family
MGLCRRGFLPWALAMVSLWSTSETIAFELARTYPVRLSFRQYSTLSSAAPPSEKVNGSETVVVKWVPPVTTVSEKQEVKPVPILEPLGAGVLRDYRARWPLYRSDVTDGCHSQCLATSLFMFFACLAPAVGFGALYNSITNGAMGTMELVTNTAVSGVIYATLSAQPLAIVGATGPVLAFVACLAQLARTWQLPFLPLYAWTGLWTSFMLLTTSLTSGSNVVRYLSRFTDEIFAFLISVIYVVEASAKLTSSFSSTTLAKALLTVTCAMTTCVSATMLKKLRRSEFYTSQIRETVSNFAPTIGVVAGAFVARWFRQSHGAAVAGLPALTLPAVFGATTSGRPWLVPLGDLPVWARWASILPAFMATLLLFLDQNITVRLVNNPRWKMTKGRRPGNMVDGMHADLLVISVMTAVQSLLGLPWLVAATVRSLSHVNALLKYDSQGQTVGVWEQRLTGTVIHALMGCCILFQAPRQLLSQVPIPVLQGLFLYLGISALPGNELWERTLGLFKDPAVAPPPRWTTSGVPRPVATRYTLIQLACLASLCWIKGSSVGVLFPVGIALLSPLRYAIERYRVVPKRYMQVLDEK